MGCQEGKRESQADGMNARETTERGESWNQRRGWAGLPGVWGEELVAVESGVEFPCQCIT